MWKRVVGWLVLVPLGIILVVFALANRHTVAVGLDPIAPDAPLIAPFEMPLFLLVYATLVVGVLLGGIGDWFGQGRHRKAERSYRREAESWREKAESLRRDQRQNDTLGLLESEQEE